MNKLRKIKLKSKTKIRGTVDKPRLVVFRSNRYFFVQLIDDKNKKTLASASNIKMQSSNNIESAISVGLEIAKKAKSLSINSVIFDRKRYRYTGRIRALGDAARNGGLIF
jgi:large subunit ribosomal protein L18